MMVRVTIGRLVALPNYENIRLEYSLEVSAKAGETASQACDRAQKWVEDRLNTEVKKIEAKLK